MTQKNESILPKEILVEQNSIIAIVKVIELKEFICHTLDITEGNDDVFEMCKEEIINNYPKESKAKLLIEMITIVDTYKHFFNSIEIKKP